MSQRRALGAALLTATFALSGLAAGAGAPAQALTGSPPVTAPDTVKIKGNQPNELDVLANDTDPDGDQLEVCRLGKTPRALHVQAEDGKLFSFPGAKAKGTYTFTYYACDLQYLTPATVTVTVKPTGTLTAKPLGELPGKVRLVNTYKQRTFHCEWRPVGSTRVEGRVDVEPRSSVVVRVHEKTVEFECRSGNVGYGLVFGRKGGVHVERTDRP